MDSIDTPIPQADRPEGDTSPGALGICPAAAVAGRRIHDIGRRAHDTGHCADGLGSDRGNRGTLLPGSHNGRAVPSLRGPDGGRPALLP